MISKPDLDGIVLIPALRFHDERGRFEVLSESHRFKVETGRDYSFVQDNISRSRKGVLRGMHYQQHPFSQGKLVTCLEGEIYDVVIDIREESPNFLDWQGFTLSEENGLGLWVPEGFAHGFLTLSDAATVFYKVTSPYSPEAECCLSWEDPSINIDWPLDGYPILSEKDQVAERARDIIDARKA